MVACYRYQYANELMETELDYSITQNEEKRVEPIVETVDNF